MIYEEIITRIKTTESWVGKRHNDIHFEPIQLSQDIFEYINVSNNSSFIILDKNGSFTSQQIKLYSSFNMLILTPHDDLEGIIKWTIWGDDEIDSKHIYNYNNDINISEEKIKKWTEEQKKLGKEIIGILNPPYKNGLHLKFLDISIIS